SSRVTFRIGTTGRRRRALARFAKEATFTLRGITARCAPVEVSTYGFGAAATACKVRRTVTCRSNPTYAGGYVRLTRIGRCYTARADSDGGGVFFAAKLVDVFTAAVLYADVKLELAIVGRKFAGDRRLPLARVVIERDLFPIRPAGFLEFDKTLGD